jgi:hypothetical protein
MEQKYEYENIYQKNYILIILFIILLIIYFIAIFNNIN